MISQLLIFFYGLFILAASCYLLFIISDPLEKVGARLGKLLRLPEPVIASTFQALATSGPEIAMSVIVATPFIAADAWQALELGEKACSGTLNMAFSAMDNLLGIGAVAIIFMIHMKMVDPEKPITVKPATLSSLAFYVFASGALAYFVKDGLLTEAEARFLMGVGILFILTQFLVPPLINKNWPPDEVEEPEEVEKLPALTTAPLLWSRSFAINLVGYAFLVFALILFVKEAIGATFRMSMTQMFSVGGILMMFTSYVSSFPEFMMAYRYTVAKKKNELLAMLFGSNVIDIAFAGFRPLWIHEPMQVYTTGSFPQLLPFYLQALPVMAAFMLIGLSKKAIKWKIAYPLVSFYIIYIVSGFLLL
jgi:Ca2+/Na+ antiporter